MLSAKYPKKFGGMVELVSKWGTPPPPGNPPRCNSPPLARVGAAAPPGSFASWAPLQRRATATAAPREQTNAATRALTHPGDRHRAAAATRDTQNAKAR